MAAQRLNSKNLFKVLLLALAPLIVVSCSKDNKGPLAPEVSPAELMAGTYDCSFRLVGGADWGPVSTFLIVRDDGTVRFDNQEIVKPTSSDTSLVWSTLDGNLHNAALRFYRRGADSAYWTDHPTIEDRNFSGVYNRPFDSQFDMRALEEPKPVPLDN